MGSLLGSYNTQNRITCVEAFVMIPCPKGVIDSEDKFDNKEEEEGKAEGSDSD